jgi:hypothetical protein
MLTPAVGGEEGGGVVCGPDTALKSTKAEEIVEALSERSSAW